MIADFAGFRKRKNVPALIFVLALASAAPNAISEAVKFSRLASQVASP
jgi:hypothetical protein